MTFLLWLSLIYLQLHQWALRVKAMCWAPGSQRWPRWGLTIWKPSSLVRAKSHWETCKHTLTLNKLPQLVWMFLRNHTFINFIILTIWCLKHQSTNVYNGKRMWRHGMLWNWQVLAFVVRWDETVAWSGWCRCVYLTL